MSSAPYATRSRRVWGGDRLDTQENILHLVYNNYSRLTLTVLLSGGATKHRLSLELPVFATQLHDLLTRYNG